MAKFAVILPAAGKSSRFSGPAGRKKVFLELAGRPVWVRSAEPFTNRQDVVQTIVVVNPDDLEWFQDKFRPNLAFMNIDIVTGGHERADSVGNALKKVIPDADFVAVHDAARPLITNQWIDQVFAAAEKHGAALPAARVTATLKKANPSGLVTATVPRDDLWLAQTPQVFRRDWLEEAYRQPGSSTATDEAQLIERMGHPVHIVESSPMNLKITTQEDFRMAEHLLNALPKEKSLRSLHPFADEDPRNW